MKRRLDKAINFAALFKLPHADKTSPKNKRRAKRRTHKRERREGRVTL